MDDFKSLDASVALLKPSGLYDAFCLSHCSSDALQIQNIFQHNSEDCELDRLEVWIPLQEIWHRSLIGANLSMYENVHILGHDLPWSRSLDPNCRVVALSNHCTEICNIKLSPWVKLQATINVSCDWEEIV